VSETTTVVRYVVSFSGAFGLTLGLTPMAGRLAHRWNILDHPSDHKFHGQATPYLGGLAVAAGLLLVTGFAAGTSGQVLTILACALGILALGLFDDWRTVGPFVKILVEIAAGLALWTVGVRAGIFGIGPLDLLATVGWVVVVTNAVNILDNMDGIASGISTIASLTFFVVAAQRGDYLVGSMALAVAGASLGFLRHNYPPARIFLGDSGSLLLGFLLAALALKLDLVGADGLIRTSVPILILAIPLFDLVLVLISRTRGGRPIYIGGTDHSAHRMARLGWTHRRVAGILYLAQSLCCALAVWLTHLNPRAILPIIAAEALIALTGLMLLLRLEVQPDDLVVMLDDIPEGDDHPADRLTSR
jgi:UDP-GlcNAc:undecaprenyl-phosphate/decaprenyl-phosphate GlcNAc-1-phosphate transferase